MGLRFKKTPESMKSSERVANGWALLILGGVGLIFFLPAMIGNLFQQPSVADSCQNTSFNGVHTTTTITGTVRYGYSTVYLDNIDGQKSIFRELASCHKGPCNKLFDTLKPLIGQTIHAEYCGKTLTRAEIGEKEIFHAAPQTQEQIDTRVFYSKVWIVACIIGLILSVLFGIKIIRNSCVNE